MKERGWKEMEIRNADVPMLSTFSYCLAQGDIDVVGGHEGYGFHFHVEVSWILSFPFQAAEEKAGDGQASGSAAILTFPYTMNGRHEHEPFDPQ
jgi:hypothetical protein